MWQGFDPLRDPLDTELVREWKEGDATYRYVVFTIGAFKGQKSRVAAFYGFPTSDKKLPAVMHLHGGGQRAFIKTVKDAVTYGYAGLSLNWGGREMEDAKPGDKNTDYNAINLGFNSGCPETTVFRESSVGTPDDAARARRRSRPALLVWTANWPGSAIGAAIGTVDF